MRFRGAIGAMHVELADFDVDTIWSAQLISY